MKKVKKVVVGSFSLVSMGDNLYVKLIGRDGYTVLVKTGLYEVGEIQAHFGIEIEDVSYVLKGTKW